MEKKFHPITVTYMRMTQSSLVLRTGAYTRASLLWTLSGGMTPVLNIKTRFIHHYDLGLDDIYEKNKHSCYILSEITRQKSLTVTTDVVKTVLMYFIMPRCYIHNTLECFNVTQTNGMPYSNSNCLVLQNIKSFTILFHDSIVPNPGTTI